MKRKISPITCLPLALLAGACGRDLNLEPRQERTVDQIVQYYEVNVFATEVGETYYVVKAALATKEEYNSKSLKLPEGDTLTLNGEDLVWSETYGDYRKTGTDATRTFDFVWTHNGVSYTNRLSAVSYLPSSIPTTISKAEGFTAQLPVLPSEVKVFANLNSGTDVAAPYYAIPTNADDSENPVESQLPNVPSGTAVLTILETREDELENATPGGGAKIVKVQYGYPVTIKE